MSTPYTPTLSNTLGQIGSSGSVIQCLVLSLNTENLKFKDTSKV